jgi:hypothetical protein
MTTVTPDMPLASEDVRRTFTKVHEVRANGIVAAEVFANQNLQKL